MNKPYIQYKKLLKGVSFNEGAFLELEDGTRVRTSPVQGFCIRNGIQYYETRNSIYYGKAYAN